MEFRILGPLEVVDGGRVLPLGGEKPRALLGALLASANEVVSVDRLLDRLWGENPPETATSALQVHVSALRKVLGREAIARRGAGYVLTVDVEAFDLARFERLISDARPLPPREAAERLREALARWRGEPEVEA